MVNAINSITNFTPQYYGINFRSNYNNNIVPGFTPKFKSPLSADVFIKTSDGGVNSSNNSVKMAEKLFPFAEQKGFVDSNSKKTVRDKKIEKEKGHISTPVTKRTEYNSKQLRAAGVPEREVNKYLTVDGHVNFEGQKILKEKGKLYR